MKRFWSALALAGVLMAGTTPNRAQALFHLAVIDEVMTSYDGDASVQFVEIRMLAIAQAFLTGTVLGAFDPNGAYLGDGDLVDIRPDVHGCRA